MSVNPFNDSAFAGVMLLDEMNVRARSNDPHTSKDAAARASDFANAHQKRVLDGLRTLGGKAGAEQIGQAIGMPAYAVRKRTSELEDMGLIEATGETRKTATGRSERIWSVC